MDVWLIMRQIKNQNLSRLLMQLRFTPQKHRRKLLDAAESLLELIDSEKQYPFEFVCFRITGYHPKHPLDQNLINGDELAEDLRTFIARLSGRFAADVSELNEKLYTIEELAKKQEVSTRTIERWRKRGLLARKYVFPNGRKKIGFLQSAVDKFLEKEPEAVSRAKNFTRLTKKEKQQIIRRASNLAAKGHAGRHRIIERISQQTGRAHETIRYILMQYEKSHPSKPVFKRPAGVIDPAHAAELYKMFTQGRTVPELMSRFDRSRSSVYRIINRRRARTLQVMKIEFVASGEFLEDDAAGKILGRSPASEKTRPDEGQAVLDVRGEFVLPQYMQTLKDAPMLDREHEVQLFRRYNYLKYLACITRAGINQACVAGTRLKKIERYIAHADRIKRTLIESNLRLVVSIAMKHVVSGASLADLVSEGNVSLMRAVEQFDYTRGVRFATHASWVIARNYARKMSELTTIGARGRGASAADIHRELTTSKSVANVAAVERTRHSLTEVIKNDLNEREQYVILNHFGLIGTTVKKQKKTLKQIGDDLGLTRERIRQIELIALQKLRQSLSPEQFELLTG